MMTLSQNLISKNQIVHLMKSAVMYQTWMLTDRIIKLLKTKKFLKNWICRSGIIIGFLKSDTCI